MATGEAHFLFKCKAKKKHVLDGDGGRRWRPTYHVCGDAGMAEKWSHPLLVNTLPTPLPAIGIYVHQEALRSVSCKNEGKGGGGVR